ncbi:hypothetical protein [Hymenobacter sp. B81]|uniref:hypothetical protein n=1 Tax=Hymenobacter sp. B81 TaxID=3344878 RepID=UPI0037DD03B2
MSQIYFLAALAASALLSGCAVYTPSLPTVPLVQQGGQAEVQASLATFTKPGLSVAYSPLRHVVLTADGSFGIRSRSDNPYRTRRQASVGGGFYAVVGQYLHLAALGSYGTAYSALRDQGSHDTITYQARYRPVSAQLSISFLGEGASGGLVLRHTWLDVRELRRNGQPVTGLATAYFEPTAFVRTGRGPWQGQFSLGLPMVDSNARLDLPRRTQRYLATNAVVVGLGVVLRPHLLGQGH